MLSVAVVRSSAGGIAICYDIPTSGFVADVMFSTQWLYGTLCMHVAKRWELNSPNYCIDSKQILLNDKIMQLNIVGCELGRSLLSTIVLL